MTTRYPAGSLPRSIRVTVATLYTSTKCRRPANNTRRAGLLLLLSLLACARTPFERLDARHLQAVHDQRVEWKKQRASLEPLGVYQDFRAVFTDEYATRPELAHSAKDAEVQVV